MVRFFFYIWLAMAPLIVAGCGLGPSMMRADRLTYNDAIQFSERQELLLNIVRLRYNEGPGFLATNSISTQFTLNLGAAAGADVGDDQEQRTSLFNIGGAIGYSERPTITFTPRNEKEFTQQLISPIDLEVIFLLINYGWDIDRVLRLTSEGINGLRNDTIRETPIVDYDLHLREFTETVKDLQRLQVVGLVELSFEEEELGLSGPISAEKVNLNDILKANENDHKLEYRDDTKTYHLKKINRNLVIRFSRNAFKEPELKRVFKRLKLAPDFQTYRILNAPGSQIKAAELPQESSDLILSTRSVLGTMAYLAQGVKIPPEHIEAGVVSKFEYESISGIISDLFLVNVKKEKPHQAGLAVPYKDYWFYIDETDVSSKRTMGVLNSLIRLKIKSGRAQNIPVLTLPVGQ